MATWMFSESTESRRTPEVSSNPNTPNPETQSLDPAEFARTRLGFHPDPLQATILQSKSKQGILNCSRQWGKSTVGAAMAVHRACAIPNSLVLVASPTERQSGEFVRKAAAMVRNMGLDPRGDGTNAISIAFENGSRIVGLPGQLPAQNGGRIRGYSVSLLIIDEAAFVEDAVYHSLRPMLAATDGDVWMMSTPNGKRGFFYETWTYGQGWQKVSAKATDCPRISRAFLEAERDTLGPTKFPQEYLCEFTESEDALFDEKLIEEAMDPTIEPLIFDWT
jgi:hypothetical protein